MVALSLRRDAMHRVSTNTENTLFIFYFRMKSTILFFTHYLKTKILRFRHFLLFVLRK
jgi:hypothetical protein